MRSLKVGDIVKCTRPILDNETGTEGVVFSEYNLGEPGLLGMKKKENGVQVIFENGEYDGFSPTEQAQMLERVGHEITLSGYKFENVMKLSRDFEDGLFNVVFG